jgi:hypothetical protein
VDLHHALPVSRINFSAREATARRKMMATVYDYDAAIAL